MARIGWVTAGLAGGLAGIWVGWTAAGAACSAGCAPAEPPPRAAGETEATSRVVWPSDDLVRACDRKLEQLRKDTGGELRYRLDVPFVVAGDIAAGELDAIVRRTIRPAAEALWRKYFDARPTEPIVILLFGERPSYTRWAKELFGDRHPPHFGYYRSEKHTLVMNISTGTGTLVHEMVHALGDFDFPCIPDWFNEGLASLYEQCTLADNDIRGLVNWRLPALQEAIRKGTLRPLKDLITADDFRGRIEGINYAQARYFCMYMESRNVLVPYYRAFRDGFRKDRTGLTLLSTVFDGKPIDEIEGDYLRWLKTLKWK